MRFLALKRRTILTVSAFFCAGFAFAQQGEITISKDPKIDKLLTYQKEINQETDNDNRLKIQIFNGNLRNAEKVKSKFKNKHSDIPVNIKFETPNYKVWVGNFRNSLEAERYLVEVKETFPNAFVFTPKKKKKKN
ncbi:SPOR domain-containing protein [uncultured Kordia sp.]|uniref:SPOR domain-containing protein n=1 Tax=uncultured Kordia sp. TaxID=507699 RepID=UPI0026050A9C|nr:SPOR domain-containing protein [uncultured Kordia sp.]